MDGIKFEFNDITSLDTINDSERRCLGYFIVLYYISNIVIIKIKHVGTYKINSKLIKSDSLCTQLT